MERLLRAILNLERNQSYFCSRFLLLAHRSECLGWRGTGSLIKNSVPGLCLLTALPLVGLLAAAHSLLSTVKNLNLFSPMTPL